MKAKKKCRVVVLNPAEDRVWTDAFNFNLEKTKSPKKADKYAARVLCQQFPHLKNTQFAP